MEFIYYDHRLRTDPFTELYDLALMLGLEHKSPTQVDTMPGPWVAFVHAGNTEQNDVRAWRARITGTSNWIVFVSTELNTLPNPDGYPGEKIKRINVTLRAILNRLRAKRQLIAYFKDSCESASGPNMHLFEGGVTWPQTALAKYLLLRTGTVVKDEELNSAHLTDQDVIDEFIARGIKLNHFNCDSLKSAILRSVDDVA